MDKVSFEVRGFRPPWAAFERLVGLALSLAAGHIDASASARVWAVTSDGAEFRLSRWMFRMQAKAAMSGMEREVEMLGTVRFARNRGYADLLAHLENARSDQTDETK